MCFFVFGPKYFKTDSFLRKTVIAPAMKKAGIKQVKTWADKYSVNALIPAKNKSVKNILKHPYQNCIIYANQKKNYRNNISHIFFKCLDLVHYIAEF